jgi:hypothetical protein
VLEQQQPPCRGRGAAAAGAAPKPSICAAITILTDHVAEQLWAAAGFTALQQAGGRSNSELDLAPSATEHGDSGAVEEEDVTKAAAGATGGCMDSRQLVLTSVAAPPQEASGAATPPAARFTAVAPRRKTCTEHSLQPQMVFRPHLEDQDAAIQLRAAAPRPFMKRLRARATATATASAALASPSRTISNDNTDVPSSLALSFSRPGGAGAGPGAKWGGGDEDAPLAVVVVLAEPCYADVAGGLPWLPWLRYWGHVQATRCAAPGRETVGCGCGWVRWRCS